MTPISTDRLHQLRRMAKNGWCLVSSVGAMTSAEAHALVEEAIAHRESAATPELDSTAPPPHWIWKKVASRHPKEAADWNWRQDPPLSEGGLELAIRRLNFASDLADPRAPDQMALVLRKDLIDIKHELLRQTALAEIRAQPRSILEPLTVARSQAIRGADKAGCDGWRSQEMCRQIVPLIDETIATLQAILQVEPEGSTADD